MERWFFQSSLAHASPATARILRQLIQIVGERLRSQYAQIIPMEAGGNTCVPCRNDSEFRSGFDDAAKTRSFYYPAFLPRLGFFSNFQPDEIRMFTSKVRSLELPRDVILFEKDERPASCFFIVRGALELCTARDDGHVPIAVLGPGTFLGTTEIISGGSTRGLRPGARRSHHLRNKCRHTARITLRSFLFRTKVSACLLREPDRRFGNNQQADGTGDKPGIFNQNHSRVDVIEGNLRFSVVSTRA